METILITGGTGLIGTAITKMLVQEGFNVIVLSRRKDEFPEKQQIRYAQWNPEKQFIDKWVFDIADHIIHLSGEGVADKRWTQKRKREIVDSRVKTANFLREVLTNYPNKIKSIIAASAIGWYGPDPEVPNSKPFQEPSPAYDDFLGTTCSKWESALHHLEALNKRLVILRTGIVLSKEGGAYPQFKKCIGPGITAILGNGKQMISWIHIKDLISIYKFAIVNFSINGVFNAVSPSPVSNEQLIRGIEHVKKRNQIKFHIPEFVLKTILGELSIEVLKSCTVSSMKILEKGFQFQYSTIKDAIIDLENRS